MADTRERLQRLPALASYEQLAAINVALARLEVKLEDLPKFLERQESLEKRIHALEMANAAASQKDRTWQWVRDSIFALALAIVGTKQWFG